MQDVEAFEYGERHVGPVKDQLSCGSCWTFAATTPVEGSIVVAQDRLADGSGTYQHLSEQQLLDCTLNSSENKAEFGYYQAENFGCNGGYVDTTFRFIEQNGLMSAADYPYLERLTDSSTGGCRHDDDQVVARISDWGMTTSSAEDIVSRLQDGPLEVFYGLSDDFFSIDGLTPLDPASTNYCGTYYHVVTVVGYEPCTEDCGETEVTTYVFKYRYLSGRRQRRRGCKSYEWRCAYSYCCWYEEETTTGNNSNGSLILLNQWGADWADNGKFRIGLVEDGSGWCDVQDRMWWVTPIVA